MVAKMIRVFVLCKYFDVLIARMTRRYSIGWAAAIIMPCKNNNSQAIEKFSAGYTEVTNRLKRLPGKI